MPPKTADDARAVSEASEAASEAASESSAPPADSSAAAAANSTSSSTPAKTTKKAKGTKGKTGKGKGKDTAAPPRGDPEVRAVATTVEKVEHARPGGNPEDAQ